MKFAAALLFASASASISGKYMEYVIKHSKSYLTSAEFQARKAIFAENDSLIEEHNSTNATFTLGHNLFSDMTEQEKARYRGRLSTEGVQKNYTVLPEANADSVNWIDAGAVNPIKDQGQCGSCWAFSSVCALEGAHFIATGKLESFAEQQLVDCSTANYGCGGGWQYKAFQYYESNMAILEKDYAYTAKDGSCQYDSLSHTGVDVSGYSWVTADSSSQTKAAIAKQPISVSIEADRYVFQLYSSGVFDSTSCGTSLDHAVALVGYGTENGQDYYLLRNSWGTSWGEAGYMKIANVGDGAGICGVQMEPLYPASN